jgi:hypothetical protein
MYFISATNACSAILYLLQGLLVFDPDLQFFIPYGDYWINYIHSAMPTEIIGLTISILQCLLGLLD